MLSVKSILFVENDLVSQSLYQKRLEREGFHVECAPDGQAALDILSERTPDLILLDLMLPKVSGADVLKFMHADPRLTTIPVIIFSNAPLTEVPPDDPLAQGTRRLLKCDCPFPTLLNNIQEALAQAPEFVVREVGKMPPAPPLAANGDDQRNGAATVATPRPESETALMKRRSEFLKEAAAMMPKIREQSMGYIKAPNSAASQTHLSGLHQRVHLLNSSADQAGCPRVALLTTAFDAMLCGIMNKPAIVTPSMLQTIAQAVDCLDGLLKNNEEYFTGPSYQAKILVVDDDTVCNHVNVSSLKRANFEVVGLKEPTAALNLLQTTPFDLVVLDVNMPGMTGFNVCEKMRRFPHCKTTPVIFVTAFSNFDNRKQSVLSGGNDFVSKPVSPLELGLKVVVNLIKARAKSGGVQASQPETHSALNNGSAGKLQLAGSTRMNQPAQSETQSPEPPNRLEPEIKLPLRKEEPSIPLQMTRPESESRPTTPLEQEQQPKMQTPMIHPGNGTPQNGDFQERLRQTSAALERAKTGLEQESAERARLESRWREQLSCAEAVVQQAENVVKEKEAHCSRLERELSESQKVKDELQTKFAAEQQTAAKAQQELKELKADLEKLSAERTRLESEVRGQLDAAKAAVTQNQTLLKEKETHCGQLENKVRGLQEARDELQNKLAAEQQTSEKFKHTINDLQERLCQGNEELGRVNAELEKRSAEQKRLETDWQQQLNAAKTAASQTEAVLAEKIAQCGQLEKEIVDLQRARDEFQNQLTTEQQLTAQCQREIEKLQEVLRQHGAELERAKVALEQESAKRAHLESECQNLTQARDAISLEFNNLRESQTAHEARLRLKQKKLAEDLRENIQLLQLRLQEVESLNGEVAEASEVQF